MSSCDIKVRLATVNDYRAVLDINKNVYAGLDYIPSMYFYFIHNPDVLLFVAELDNKIVAFSGFWLLEERTAAVSMALRSHVDYQGRGIMTALNRLKEDYLRRHLTKPFHIRVTEVYNPKLHLSNRRHLNDQFAVICEWHHIAYTPSQQQVSSNLSLLEDKVTSFPITPGLGRTIDILEDERTLSLLRGSDDTIVGGSSWLPVKVCAENLKLLAKLSSHVSFTMSADRCSAVSFAYTLLLGDDTIRLDLYYYGDCDVATLTSHLATYLRHSLVTARMYTSWSVLVHFPIGMNGEAVDMVLSRVLGERYGGDSNFTTMRTVASETRSRILPIAKL